MAEHHYYWHETPVHHGSAVVVVLVFYFLFIFYGPWSIIAYLRQRAPRGLVHQHSTRSGPSCH